MKAVRWVVGGIVSLALVGGAATGQVDGQSPDQATADEFERSVQPVLAKNCVTCHNDRVRTASFSLEPLTSDPLLAAQKPDVWQKVLDKLNTGQMPPRPRQPLSAPELAAITGWIHKLPGLAPGSTDVSTADPGRVTARRLNRNEYNNTVRDLLGVTLRPADDFPIDDSGYGFDNIGDVLSMSPLLMEKYINAAQKVSQAAVFGEPYPEKAGQLASLQPKKLQDDSPARGSETPYSLRGAFYARFHFPVDGEYEFRWRYGNYRGRGKPVGPGRPFAVADSPAADAQPDVPVRGQGPGPGGGGVAPAPRRPLTEQERRERDERLRTAFAPLLMTFAIDGQPVQNEYVEGDGNYNYSHGDNIARVKVTAGDHDLRVSWPELADHPDPFRLVNADGRQELFVDYMRILGPYNPSTAPPANLTRIFICGEPGHYTNECVRQIVTNLLTRAYRRAPAADEVQGLVNLVETVRKEDTIEDGIRLAIEFVLVSPHFLFRIERDTHGEAGSYQISDYELASRLSYFLWSSMPDDELLRVAGQNQLHDPVAMNAQVQRMLKDAKASALVESFGSQWLNLYLMDRTKPDSDKFLAVDDELLDAMRKETLSFVDAVFRENRSILDFIDGRYTFVNGPLARYYGIRGIKGEEFQRVTLDGDRRSGILTQGAILKISSYSTRTSPVLRGKWVLDTLLGAAPPPPPDNIPPLEEQGLGTAASMRERLAEHRANPTCGACHNRMDPIGFSLEHYDAAGAWRDADGSFEIDATGTLPDGRAIAGAKGLKDILRADAPLFARNFSEKLMTYALGRGVERSDRVFVDEIMQTAAGNDFQFASIVAGIVNSRPFRMRAKAGVIP